MKKEHRESIIRRKSKAPLSPVIILSALLGLMLRQSPSGTSVLNSS